jgi:hypothetical protein
MTVLKGTLTYDDPIFHVYSCRLDTRGLTEANFVVDLEHSVSYGGLPTTKATAPTKNTTANAVMVQATRPIVAQLLIPDPARK